ncbi:hypothetical protein F5050DRAFT_1783830 [Lentinula boryana]|uniref:Uncharacterized protein n=1 Tax=Lentinula boryana TaxID=40481 RepID=A0ABQ8Q3H6_9AGAR|nr:hypothetical protein F5050DRAFT_1783830 [Lentinula boryana]
MPLSLPLRLLRAAFLFSSLLLSMAAPLMKMTDHHELERRDSITNLQVSIKRTRNGQMLAQTDPIQPDEVWTPYIGQSNSFITLPEVLNGLHVLKGKLNRLQHYTPPPNLEIGRVSFDALDVKHRIFMELASNDLVAATSFDYVIKVVNHLLDETRKNIGVRFAYNENLSKVDPETGRKSGLYWDMMAAMGHEGSLVAVGNGVCAKRKIQVVFELDSDV